MDENILRLTITNLICLLTAIFISTQCLPSKSCPSNSLLDTLKYAHIPEYQYQIVTTYPHDTNSFTEGLFFQNGLMYESSGLYGKSRLSITELDTLKIQKQTHLSKQYFAEGMTILGNNIYQLTWLEHTGFVYDKETLRIKQTFSIPSQGWGLTTNGKQLIMSDGTETISLLDPSTLKTIRSFPVTIENQKISSINELEYINGMIFANIWPTSIILIISPENGKVTAWFDVEKLSPPLACMECVANGIAFNEKENVIYLTGKNWPNLYAIRLNIS